MAGFGRGRPCNGDEQRRTRLNSEAEVARRAPPRTAPASGAARFAAQAVEKYQAAGLVTLLRPGTGALLPIQDTCQSPGGIRQGLPLTFFPGRISLASSVGEASYSVPNENVLAAEFVL